MDWINAAEVVGVMAVALSFLGWYSKSYRRRRASADQERQKKRLVEQARKEVLQEKKWFGWTHSKKTDWNKVFQDRVEQKMAGEEGWVNTKTGRRIGK